MTAQSLLVVLREEKERLLVYFRDREGDQPMTELETARCSKIHATETAIRVIEEVLRSTRETRKELGDNTLETEADLGLGSSTPS